MKFCNFCECSDCEFGRKDLCHAPTLAGLWVCDVCYAYDLCTNGPSRGKQPCKDGPCIHRPILVGPWEKFGNFKPFKLEWWQHHMGR